MEHQIISDKKRKNRFEVLEVDRKQHATEEKSVPDNRPFQLKKKQEQDTDPYLLTMDNIAKMVSKFGISRFMKMLDIRLSTEDQNELQEWITGRQPINTARRINSNQQRQSVPNRNTYEGNERGVRTFVDLQTARNNAVELVQRTLNREGIRRVTRDDESDPAEILDI